MHADGVLFNQVKYFQELYGCKLTYLHHDWRILIIYGLKENWAL